MHTTTHEKVCAFPGTCSFLWHWSFSERQREYIVYDFDVINVFLHPLHFSVVRRLRRGKVMWYSFLLCRWRLQAFFHSHASYRQYMCNLFFDNFVRWKAISLCYLPYVCACAFTLFTLFIDCSQGACAPNGELRGGSGLISHFVSLTVGGILVKNSISV